MRNYLKVLAFLGMLVCAPRASATSSAELLTAESYGYGRVEARVRFAPGDGVVSSVFLWKDGSEQPGTFWNELDFEKLGGDCRLETNPIYGKPPSNHTQRHALELDLCSAFHTYTFEWTPEAIIWLVDGVEIRRATGAVAQAFEENASGGMQIHFNLWPGDVSFGGNFNPAIVPVHEYVDWVQFSAYAEGEFELAWREDFDGASLPEGWLTGNWPSPKKHSTHAPENVNFIDGYAVLSLTADDALGPAGANPEGPPEASGTAGSSSGAPPLTEGSRPSAGGCSFGRGKNPCTGLGALAALALVVVPYRARRHARRRAGNGNGEGR
jgi:beta-glucanase (GH16 family)